MLINKIFASDCDVCSSPGPHLGGAAVLAPSREDDLSLFYSPEYQS